MKAQAFYTTIWAFIFTAIPFVYLAFIWDSLPAQLVLDISQSNRMGSRQGILLQLILISVFGLFIYFGMVFSHLFVSKDTTLQSKKLSAKLALINLAFFNALSVYIIYTAVHHKLNNFLFILLGLLIMAMGNFMYSIPFKHPLGLRLPWMRESEDNWRKTHRLYSKMGVFIGLIMIITGLLLAEPIVFYLQIVVNLVVMFVPIIYSYWLTFKTPQV
jgi:uncharacterized membrane protein